MAARKTSKYALILSYRGGAFNAETAPDFAQLTRRHLKALSASLRKEARKNNWSYHVLIGPSMTDPRTGKKVRLHVHAYIEANPGATVTKWMRQYWHARHGIVNSRKCEEETDQLICYIRSQALYVWENEENVAQLETDGRGETPEKIGKMSPQELDTCLSKDPVPDLDHDLYTNNVVKRVASHKNIAYYKFDMWMIIQHLHLLLIHGMKDLWSPEIIRTFGTVNYSVGFT